MPCPGGTPTDTSWPWGLSPCPHSTLPLLPGERRGAGERLGRPAPLCGHPDPKRNGAFFPWREVCEPFQGVAGGDGPLGLEAHSSRPPAWVRWKRCRVFCHIPSSGLVWRRSCPHHPSSPSSGHGATLLSLPLLERKHSLSPPWACCPCSPSPLCPGAVCRGAGAGAELEVTQRSPPACLAACHLCAHLSPTRAAGPCAEPASPAAPSLF